VYQIGLTVTFPEFKPQQPQLAGNCANIPEEPVLPFTLNENQRAAVQGLATFARNRREWVGVNLMHVAAALDKPEPGVTPVTTPSAWFDLNREKHSLIKIFLSAANAGYVTVVDGYAYPTQRLADLVLSQSGTDA
jgi:hypothetical protein